MNNKEKKIEAIKTKDPNKTALLIGNGINRRSKKEHDLYDWEKLLNDLSIEFTGNRISNNSRYKPFPMFYDEIVNYAVAYKNKRENDVKDSFSNRLANITHSSKYDFLNNINFDEILTTNYDYLIENYLNPNWRRKSVTKYEKYYSLSRFQESNPRVWHIHGEMAEKRSMLLGFRLYLNYTARIRERASSFITSIKQLTKKELKYDSWVDLFFTHNIYILGLGMEFTEYNLWWLLAYRNFIKLSDPKIIVDNEITFITPSFEIESKPHLQQMLEAYGVKIEPITVNSPNDYDSFYEELKLFKFK